MARGNRKSSGISAPNALSEESFAFLVKTRDDKWREKSNTQTPGDFSGVVRDLRYEVSSTYEVMRDGSIKFVSSQTDGAKRRVSLDLKAYIKAVNNGNSVITVHNHPNWGGSFSPGDLKCLGWYAKGTKEFHAVDDVWDYKFEGMNKPEWAAKYGYSVEALRYQVENYGFLGGISRADAMQRVRDAQKVFKAGYLKVLSKAQREVKEGSENYTNIVQKSVDTVYERLVSRGQGPAPGVSKEAWWMERMQKDYLVRTEIFREVNHLKNEFIASRIGLKYTRTLRPGLTEPAVPKPYDNYMWNAYGSTSRPITPGTGIPAPEVKPDTPSKPKRTPRVKSQYSNPY